MQRYEIVTFTFPIGGPAKALPRIEAYLNGAGHGTVRACWTSEIGSLNELLAAMYAIDGDAPRFTHIWPYRTLEERARIRAAAIEANVWPPKGGADHILTMRNAIYVAAPFSPLK